MIRINTSSITLFPATTISLPHQPMCQWALANSLRDHGLSLTQQNDWQTVCVRADIPYQALPRKNITQYKNYRDMFDRDSVQLVAKHWAREIKEFDYDFDKFP